MTDDEIRAFAKRFFDAVEQGDVDTVGECYTDDVVIWHNTDSIGTSKEENLAVLRAMVGRIKDRVYDERQVETFENGFVQQHVLRGTRKDGARLALPAGIICRIRDGRIYRLDEYFDSAHVAEFRKTFD